MTNWYGGGSPGPARPSVLPPLPDEARSAMSRLVQTQHPRPVESAAAPVGSVVVVRCPGCRTSYGSAVVYGGSGVVWLFCQRSRCHEATPFAWEGR